QRIALVEPHEHADAPYALALLCVRCNRPNHRAPEPRDELPPSFDYLVGLGEERRRKVEAEGLRRLEIDRQLELGGPLDLQIGGARAFENPVDVAGCTLHRVGGVGCVGYQPATRWER